MEIGADLPEVEYLGVSGSIPPAVSLSARFVSGQGKNVSGGSLAPGSVLVIKGDGEVTLNNVKIDGAMIVETVQGAKVLPPPPPSLCVSLSLSLCLSPFLPVSLSDSLLSQGNI